MKIPKNKQKAFIEELRTLRLAGDFTALGNIYWDVFILMDRKTKFYKEILKEYNKLTELQKEALG